jgi:glycerophosphoryl diester phosphodiesterase
MTTPVGANRPFFQSSKNFPEVIAHRGGGGEWPEETLYAFDVDGIITDFPTRLLRLLGRIQ